MSDSLSICPITLFLVVSRVVFELRFELGLVLCTRLCEERDEPQDERDHEDVCPDRETELNRRMQMQAHLVPFLLEERCQLLLFFEETGEELLVVRQDQFRCIERGVQEGTRWRMLGRSMLCLMRRLLQNPLLVEAAHHFGEE